MEYCVWSLSIRGMFNIVSLLLSPSQTLKCSREKEEQKERDKERKGIWGNYNISTKGKRTIQTWLKHTHSTHIRAPTKKSIFFFSIKAAIYVSTLTRCTHLFELPSLPLPLWHMLDSENENKPSKYRAVKWRPSDQWKCPRHRWAIKLIDKLKQTGTSQSTKPCETILIFLIFKLAFTHDY